MAKKCVVPFLGGSLAVPLLVGLIACGGGNVAGPGDGGRGSPSPTPGPTPTPTPTPTMGPAPLVASFRVTSTSAVTSNGQQIFAAGSNNICPLVPVPNTAQVRLGCVFDGAASSGAVTRWRWRYEFGNQRVSPLDSPTAQYTPNEPRDCGFFPVGGATSALGMTVELIVFDANGNQSAVERNQRVSIYPQNQCGSNF